MSLCHCFVLRHVRLQTEQYCLVSPLPLCSTLCLARACKKWTRAIHKGFLSNGRSHPEQASEQVPVSVLSPIVGLRFRCAHSRPQPCLQQEASFLFTAAGIHTLFPCSVMQRGLKWQHTCTLLMKSVPSLQS